jgi:hypothetical protein
MEHSRRSLLLTFLLILCGVGKVYAAWEFVPELTLTAETDDNLRLLPDEAPDTGNSGFTMLDGRVTMSSTGTRGSLIFEPRLRAEYYSKTTDEVFDGSDSFVHFRGARELRLGNLGFRADYDRQDIRDAEITEATPDDPDVDDPIDPDTGRLLVVNQDRERLVVAPYADFQLSERSSVILEAELLDVSYSEAPLSQFSGRVDFENTQFATGIRRRVDERNELEARLVISNYQADYIQNQTDTVGVEGRFSRPLERGWRFDLTTGVSRSDFTFLDGRGVLVANADTSFTYSVRLRQRTELNTINIDLSRETNPNSGGYLFLRDEIRAYVRRSMSERLTGGIGVRAYHTRTVDDFAEDDERDYARLELEMEWAFTQRLFLAGGYAFTTQEFQSEGPFDASSNAVYLGVTYRGLSRE